MLNYDGASPQIHVTTAWITNEFLSTKATTRDCGQINISAVCCLTPTAKSSMWVVCNYRDTNDHGVMLWVRRCSGIDILMSILLRMSCGKRQIPGWQTNPISIEPHWSLPPKDIDESGIMLLVPTIASIPGKSFSFHLLEQKDPQRSVLWWWLCTSASLGENRWRRERIFPWYSGIILQKCSSFSYSAYRSLKLSLWWVH